MKTLQNVRHSMMSECRRTDGTRYFFLSIVGISVLSAFSQMTYASRHAQHPNGKWNARNAELRADTHRYPVWVLLPDALCLGLALLWKVGRLMSSDRAHRRAAPPTEGVLILELGPHGGLGMWYWAGAGVRV